MGIFLRAHERHKDGKTNTYWSLVENGRCAGGRVVQRHVLYLGKLTPAQELSGKDRSAVRREPKVRPVFARLGHRTGATEQGGSGYCRLSEVVS